MAREARVERYIGYGRTARFARKPPFSLRLMGGEVFEGFMTSPRDAPLRSFDTPPALRRVLYFRRVAASLVAPTGLLCRVCAA